MDGLPPPPTQEPPQQQQPMGFPSPQQPGQRPVGRPSRDPDADADRAMRQEQRKRLESVLPAESTDSRIAVYRLKGHRGVVRRSQRPTMTILIRELESAVENGTDPKDYIEEMIETKCRKGRFQCVPQDHKGRTLTNYGTWEVDLEALDDDDDEDDFDDDDDEVEAPPPRSRFRPLGQMGPPPTPPPSGHLGNIVGDLRSQVLQSREDEKKQSQDTMAMVMQMMAQSQQSQMAQMQLMLSQQQSQAAAQTEMIVAMFGGSKSQAEEQRQLEREERERREREAERREERERQRREDTLKWMAATIMPIITPLMSRLTEDKPDVMMPLIMDMLKNNNNNSSAKELMAMMNAAAQSQIQLQGEVSKQAMEANSKTNAAMMQHVLSMSQEVTKSMLEAASNDDGDDPMDKFGKLMKSISPVIQMMGDSGQQQLPQPTSPQFTPEMQRALEMQERQRMEEEEAQAEEEEHVQTPEGPVQAPPPVNDPQATLGVIETVRRLETNEIPANQRIAALKWCADHMPRDVRLAIQANDQARILELFQPVVMQNQHLIKWVQGDGVDTYLMDSLDVIREILHGEMDVEKAQDAIARHMGYLKAKGVEPLLDLPQQKEEPQQQPEPVQQVQPVQQQPEPPQPVQPPRRRLPPIEDDEEVPEAAEELLESPASAEEEPEVVQTPTPEVPQEEISEDGEGEQPPTTGDDPVVP